MRAFVVALALLLGACAHGSAGHHHHAIGVIMAGMDQDSVGVPKAIAPASAGANTALFICPAGFKWVVRGFFAEFVTSAVVANRQVQISAKVNPAASVEFASFRLAAIQAASLTRYYNLAVGLLTETLGNQFNAPIAPWVIEPGGNVTVSVFLGDAGDAFTDGLRLAVTEYAVNPNA